MATAQNLQISFTEPAVPPSTTGANSPAPKVDASKTMAPALSVSVEKNSSSSENTAKTNSNGRPNNKRSSLDNAFFNAIARRRIMSYTESETKADVEMITVENHPASMDSSSSTCSSTAEDHSAFSEDAWAFNSLSSSYNAPGSAALASSAPGVLQVNSKATLIHQRNNNILKTIQTIVELNDTAIDCYRVGEYDASLEALREAESRRETLVSSTKTVSVLNSTSESTGAKCTDEEAANDTNNKAVARSSYIYQRMDFDEGMHSYSNLEKMDGSDIIEFIPSEKTRDGCATVEANTALVQANILFNVGQVHRRRGEFDVAAAKYEAALAVLRSIKSDSSTSQKLLIPIYHNIGQLQYRRGELTSAMEIYDTALTHAKSMEEGSVHVASALNCLGVLHYHANSSENENGGETSKIDSDPSSTDKAMELFQQALSMRIQCLGPDHVDVATTLNNIGRIFVQGDQFDQALGYYQDALRIRRISLGTNSLDYAATAFNAGQSLHQKGDLDEAAKLYHEFLRVATIKFGKSHRDVAVVLSGIAQIHQEKGEFEKALELYEESLAAGKAALGEYHSEIAMLLNRMGNFHFERERLDDALKCYRRGLRIEKKVLPPDHPNIVVTYSNLGEIHRQRSEWEDAAKMYGDALEILKKKHSGADNADVASTLNTIGLIHDQRGDICLSLHCLQDALMMRRRLMMNENNTTDVCEQRSLDVAATLVYIGTILYRKSLFPVAIELYTESLAIRQKILGKYHRDTAFVLYNIALVHQQRGEYEQSIEFYTETLRIEKIVLGEKHKDVCMTLYKLGEVNKAANKLTEALQCFQESLEIERGLSNNPSQTAGRRSQQSGPDPATMARTLTEIGNIHLAQGDVVPMMDAFNEASRLYRSAGLSPHNVVVSGHLYALEFSFPEAAPAA